MNHDKSGLRADYDRLALAVIDAAIAKAPGIKYLCLESSEPRVPFNPDLECTQNLSAEVRALRSLEARFERFIHKGDFYESN